MVSRVRTRLEQLKQELENHTIYKEGLPGSALDIVNVLLEDLAADEQNDPRIPKKPKTTGSFDSNGVFHTWNGVNGRPYLLCPSCEKNLCCEMPNDRKPKFCEECGQALDWEVKNGAPRRNTDGK